MYTWNNMYPQSTTSGINSQPVQTSQPQQDFFIKGNRETAINYPVAPGSVVWILDVDDFKVYLKDRRTPNAALTMRMFDLVEAVLPQPVTESDISDLRKAIEELKTELASLSVKEI